MSQNVSASAPAPDLSVVILNWNARPYLVACLDSILGQKWAHETQIIVVDNASQLDDSVATVKRDYPTVQLIENPRNSGFAAGNNLGWKAARGEFVLFLNPDTVVENGALYTLLRWMKAHPEVGAVGPRMTYPDGELQHSSRAFPSFGAGLFRNSFLGRLWPQNPWSRGYLMSDADKTAARAVDWLSGSAILARREALQSIMTPNGPWDEDFFMYCEDIDLSYRLMLRGWPRFYVPDATIQHHIGKSSDLAQGTSIRRHHAAMWLFYRKHYAKGLGLLLAPVAAAGIVVRASLSVLKLYRGYAKAGVFRIMVRRKVRSKGGAIKQRIRAKSKKS
jgi:GT2 family glycosyltransferase